MNKTLTPPWQQQAYPNCVRPFPVSSGNSFLCYADDDGRCYSCAGIGLYYCIVIGYYLLLTSNSCCFFLWYFYKYVIYHVIEGFLLEKSFRKAGDAALRETESVNGAVYCGWTAYMQDWETKAHVLCEAKTGLFSVFSLVSFRKRSYRLG